MYISSDSLASECTPIYFRVSISAQKQNRKPQEKTNHFFSRVSVGRIRNLHLSNSIDRQNGPQNSGCIVYRMHKFSWNFQVENFYDNTNSLGFKCKSVVVDWICRKLRKRFCYRHFLFGLQFHWAQPKWLTFSFVRLMVLFARLMVSVSITQSISFTIYHFVVVINILFVVICIWNGCFLSLFDYTIYFAVSWRSHQFYLAVRLV